VNATRSRRLLRPRARPQGCLALLVLCAGLGLLGCNSGSKSTTESTPPELSWSLIDQYNNVRLPDKYGDGEVTSGPKDHFLITFKAKDDGGVKRITLSGDQEWACSQDHVANSNTALIKSQSSTLHPDANGKVEHYVFLLTTLSPNAWGEDCNTGYHFSGGAATLHGSATNYSNRTAHATLTIKRPN